MKNRIADFRLKLQNLDKELGTDDEFSDEFIEICDYFQEEISDKKEEIEGLEDQILELEKTTIKIPEEHQTITTMNYIEGFFGDLNNINTTRQWQT